MIFRVCVTFLAAAACACDGSRPPNGADASRSNSSAPASNTPDQRPAQPKLDARLTAALRAIKSRHFDEARRQVEVYSKAPDAAHAGQAEFILGLSYHEQQLYESACPHFARAVELEPGYFTAFYFYGFALFNLGRLDEAERAFDAFLAQDPGDADAVFGQGLVALEQDRVERAEQLMLRAIALAEARTKTSNKPAELREDSARYQARLGDVYLRRDDLARARTAFERSVELWPDHSEPWHKLASVLRRLGDAEGADRAQAKSAQVQERRTSKENRLR